MLLHIDLNIQDDEETDHESESKIDDKCDRNQNNEAGKVSTAKQRKVSPSCYNYIIL
jgi:hypothetical protein